MNRKERKRLAKQLGINKHVKTLSRAQRFERMSNNITSGKKTHQEFVERTALSELEQIEEKESNILASEASKIAAKQGLPFIDALEIAKTELKK